jgi:hypothetical protein
MLPLDVSRLTSIVNRPPTSDQDKNNRNDALRDVVARAKTARTCISG